MVPSSTGENGSNDWSIPSPLVGEGLINIPSPLVGEGQGGGDTPRKWQQTPARR